ncbi:MAG: hypothetical protein AAB419_04835 [Pseudomonadota bacterium]
MELVLVVVLVVFFVLLVVDEEEFPLAWRAVEFSFADAPAPLCVDVAVAFWVLVVPVFSLLFVGFASAWPPMPKASAIADASNVLFIRCSQENFTLRLSLRPPLIQPERRLEVQVPHGCWTSLPLRIFSASTHGARRIPLKYKGWRGIPWELFPFVVRRTFTRNLCMGVDMSQRCDTDFGRQANRPGTSEKNARNSMCYDRTSDTLKTATRVTAVKQRCHRPPTIPPQGAGKPD